MCRRVPRDDTNGDGNDSDSDSDSDDEPGDIFAEYVGVASRRVVGMGFK